MTIQAPESIVFTPEFIDDPYPEIARLRAEDPVHWVPQAGLWFVTRYDDVKRLLHDPENVSPDPRMWEFYSPPAEGTFQRWAADHSLFALEPSEHVRVRRLVSSAFTPRAIARMDAQVREVVTRFARPLAGRSGVVDLMGEFTDPIPNTIISVITGVPPEGGDEQRFRRLAQQLILGFAMFADDQTREQAGTAFSELATWVRQMAEERRRHPREDLISDLVTAHDMDDSMTSDEIVTLVAGLLAAGTETTALGGLVAIITLLEHPELLDRLRNDRSLIPQALLEIVRFGFGGPGGLQRYAARDFELRGKRIRKGQLLILSFAGANRDPNVYEDPDSLNIDRDLRNLLSFGYGPHYCLGVHLARAEMRCVIDSVLDFLPPGATFRQELMTFSPVGMIKRPSNLPVDFG